MLVDIFCSRIVGISTVFIYFFGNCKNLFFHLTYLKKQDPLLEVNLLFDQNVD